MARKWYSLVLDNSRVVAPLDAVTIEQEDVSSFRDAVKAKFADTDLLSVSPTRLAVYSDRLAWLRASPPLSSDAPISLLGLSGAEPLVVCVLPNPDALQSSPSRFDPASLAAPHAVLWVGVSGSLDGECTLERQTLTAKVVQHLDAFNVALVSGPATTGKTTLAALVCRELVRRATRDERKAIVASFTLRDMAAGESFRELFQRQCGMDWSWIDMVSGNNFTVYLVVDDAHRLFPSEPTDAPTAGAAEFWSTVQAALKKPHSRIKVLALTAYAPAVVFLADGTRVGLSSMTALGANDLSFDAREMGQFVVKFFYHRDFILGLIDQFCDLLSHLIGGHVGLVATAIAELNAVGNVVRQTTRKNLSAKQWLAILDGSSDLIIGDRPVLDEIIGKLLATRALDVALRVEEGELRVLKQLTVGSQRVYELSCMLNVVVHRLLLIELADDSTRDHSDRDGDRRRATQSESARC